MFRPFIPASHAFMRIGRLVPLIAALALSGCATLGAKQRAECTWFEVENQPGLAASGQRRLGHGHTGPHMCGSVDVFTLERQLYSIEAWNSDWVSPVMFLRATGATEEDVLLDAPALERTAVGGALVNGPAALKFQYVFRAHTFVDGQVVPRQVPFALEIRVLNRAGAELGRETLMIVAKRGHFFFSEW